jgi:hypothetical protein
MKQITTGLALAALLAAVPGNVEAVVGQPRTAGPNYDRNASVVEDGGLTYLFFARSELPCNRLAGCNPDNQQYDLWYEVSPDGGKTYGPAMLLAVNPDGLGPFYGRTIAAVRTVDDTGAGTLYVFWASGGNSNDLYYVVKPPNANFGALLPVVGTTPLEVFNVEAVAGPTGILLYTEECCTTQGIFAYRFDGLSATARTPVIANRSLPKAIVDNQPGAFRYRMTYVDASGYPTVDVWVASSTDGLVWSHHQRVVTEPAVSNWDPNLAQLPNGHYYLHFAPDAAEGAGRQRIGVTSSNDFVSWSAPRDVSPGFNAGIEYWDYWPEGFVLGNKLTLYYTSEREFDGNPAGTGHIWTLPGYGGVNDMPNNSAEVSSDGSSPAGWTAFGAANWSSGGTDGARSLTTGPLGQWVSDPVAIQPGQTYGVMADAAGAGGKVVIEQLGAAGLALSALTRTLTAVADGAFATLDDVVAPGSDVTAIRIRLEGGLIGDSTFDDIRLWKQ